MSAVTNC